MPYPRRDVLKLALGALPAAHLLGTRAVLAAAKPNSKIAGVQIGIIAPYAFRRTANTVEEVLEGLVEIGLDAVELQNTAVEGFAGDPERPPRRRRRGEEPTPEERAAREGLKYQTFIKSILHKYVTGQLVESDKRAG